MASAPVLPLVSVDEYLNSSWHPDKEYVDGMLVDRIVPTFPHALLQRLLIRLFEQFEEPYRFVAVPEARTQVVERARYRIPDVLFCPRPLPKGRIVDVVPLAVMEIVSPEDRITETLERFRDYAAFGVTEIFLLDPENYTAHRFKGMSLLRTNATEIAVPGGTIPFDIDALFEKLRYERERD